MRPFWHRTWCHWSWDSALKDLNWLYMSKHDEGALLDILQHLRTNVKMEGNCLWTSAWLPKLSSQRGLHCKLSQVAAPVSSCQSITSSQTGGDDRWGWGKPQTVSRDSPEMCITLLLFFFWQNYSSHWCSGDETWPKSAAQSDSSCYSISPQNANDSQLSKNKFPIRNEWEKVKRIDKLKDFNQVQTSKAQACLHLETPFKLQLEDKISTSR